MAKKISRKIRLALYATIVLILGAGAGAVDNLRRGTGMSPTPQAFADGTPSPSDGTGGPGDAGPSDGSDSGPCPSDSGGSDCCN